MAKKASKDFKVVVSFVPCDPGEWEQALELFAEMVVEAYLAEKQEKPNIPLHNGRRRRNSKLN